MYSSDEEFVEPPDELKIEEDDIEVSVSDVNVVLTVVSYVLLRNVTCIHKILYT